MTDANMSTAERKTIADYGLVRQAIYFTPLSTEFMEPYIGPDASAKNSWVSFNVRNGAMDKEYNSYAVSAQLNTYVTLSVFLTYGASIGDQRAIPMRYRDMMVDNYLAAGGDLKTWRYIGAQSIVHKPTIELIEYCFSQAGLDVLQPGAVQYVPSTENFLQVALCNPFTRGILRLLEQHEEETGHAKVKRYVFISVGLQQQDLRLGLGPNLHIVVELCRPGEEGYAGGSN